MGRREFALPGSKQSRGRPFTTQHSNSAHDKTTLSSQRLSALPYLPLQIPSKLRLAIAPIIMFMKHCMAVGAALHVAVVSFIGHAVRGGVPGLGRILHAATTLHRCCHRRRFQPHQWYQNSSAGWTSKQQLGQAASQQSSQPINQQNIASCIGMRPANGIVSLALAIAFG